MNIFFFVTKAIYTNKGICDRKSAEKVRILYICMKDEVVEICTQWTQYMLGVRFVRATKHISWYYSPSFKRPDCAIAPPPLLSYASNTTLLRVK